VAQDLRYPPPFSHRQNVGKEMALGARMIGDTDAFLVIAGAESRPGVFRGEGFELASLQAFLEVARDHSHGVLQ